mmetsp:Transcript_38409/g.92595  ORF Transcript_38409/g.92595 Transcript_38409/m.92595 type:complete len:126 (+) Transcript_38409:163-540(+)
MATTKRKLESYPVVFTDEIARELCSFLFLIVIEIKSCNSHHGSVTETWCIFWDETRMAYSLIPSMIVRYSAHKCSRIRDLSIERGIPKIEPRILLLKPLQHHCPLHVLLGDWIDAFSNPPLSRCQ